MENKSNNTGNEMSFAILVGGLVGVAAITQRQEQIKWWFYQHMMMLSFIVFLLVALIVMRFLHKMKKKEADLLSRMRAVKSVQPSRDQVNYYQRRRR